ncbi:hypothetical protein McanMca71_001256 [Microsporum canis]
MPKRIIIDTDPGVDDILALLLAFSSSAEELQVLLVSLTFGNIEIRKEVESHYTCLRNAVSVFHVVEKELAWRRERGLAPGFEALRACKPIVACGADRALDSEPVDAGYFHGFDGLGNVHTKCPHLSAEESYEALFAPGSADGTAASVRELEAAGEQGGDRLYTPSRELAHREMLRLLRENDAGTITIVAVGPLTNLALAAAEDLDAFLRAKEVVIMGGAIDEPGNVTPFAEFNVFADPVAAARVLALTSSRPRLSSAASPTLPCPPGRLDRPLTLKMAPLDLTHRHNFTPSAFRAAIQPRLSAGSPVAELVSTVVEHTFDTIRALRLARQGREAVEGEEEMSLHDPVCVWYVLTGGGWRWSERDVRVETRGQWTRGMTVVDRRVRAEMDTAEAEEAEAREDDRGWWRVGANRVGVLEEGPGLLSEDLLARLEK